MVDEPKVLSLKRSFTKSLDHEDTLNMKMKEKASYNDFFFGKLNWGPGNNKPKLNCIDDIGNNV